MSVVLNVPALPSQLSVAPGSLAFSAVSTAPAASSQVITITNSGGGTLGIGSVTCSASWCKPGGAPPQLAAGVAGSINVTADPTGLNPGFYWSAVDIVSSGGKATVPVTFFIAANPSLTLAPSGFQTQVPAGGSLSIPPTSFNIAVSTSQTVAWTASVTGAAWLKLASTSGSASGSQPGVLNYSIDAAAISQLTPGTYYNSIRVASAGIANSPQDFTVVVTVTAATDRQKPNPSPAGLLFLTSAAASPPAQSVALFTSSNSTEPFQVSTSTDRGGAWLSAGPSTGTTSSAATAQVNVAVDPSKLTPGVYRGQVDFALIGNAVRSVNVTVVVQAAAAALLPSSTDLLRQLTDLLPQATDLLPRAGCSPTQIVPTQTGLVNNFSAPTAWPTSLEVILANDCGDRITGGQIVSTFSNGDPPFALTLTDPQTGRYSGTWTPRKTASQVTINAQASVSGFPPATIKLLGAVTPSNAPVLDKDAVLNIYNPVGGVPTAPGTLVRIKGSYLASQPVTNTTIPLPTTLGGTKVIIGGVPAPIASVSPGLVSVQVPFELKAGQPYQVVISANGALTTPDGLQVADTSPGLSLLPSGFVNATHQAGGAITEISPAKPGEAIAIYLAGMGLVAATVDSGTATAGPASVAIAPDITIGGIAATFTYAGLTPGLVGVYQINLLVPDKAPDGNLTLQLSQAGAPSNSGLLPVKK